MVCKEFTESNKSQKLSEQLQKKAWKLRLVCIKQGVTLVLKCIKHK